MNETLLALGYPGGSIRKYRHRVPQQLTTGALPPGHKGSARRFGRLSVEAFTGLRQVVAAARIAAPAPRVRVAR